MSDCVNAHEDITGLLRDVRACRLCENLPLGPKPLLQIAPQAPILIAGQAPGRRTHEKGIPFDDPSGERLRQWLGVDRASFYDATKFAIMPMGLCFPGTGKGGDLPPRAECAPAWRTKLLNHLPRLELTLVIGAYAQNWHLKGQQDKNLTQTVKNWQNFWPAILPVPHPSPRNLRWFIQNPWFEAEIIPALQARVQALLKR